MHLRRIAAALLVGHEKHRRGVLVDLGLGLELEQRNRRIALEPPSRIDEMADALERRAVIGEILLGQRAQRIGVLQPREHVGIDVQRDARAVRGLGQQQLLVGRALVVDRGTRRQSARRSVTRKS